MSKYISDIELERFNTFQRTYDFNEPTYYLMSELPSIDRMFASDDIYYVFLFIENPKSQVGHWTVLIKWSENVFEYFDCLADPTPTELEQRIQEYSDAMDAPTTLITLNKPLMDRKNWICGKWCMFRIMTMPHTLDEMKAFFDKVSITPDTLVDFTINLKL